MSEEMPPTGMTLGEAKQWMNEHFVKHTFKKTSHLYFGLLIYDVQAIEEVPNANSLRKRQFRLYAESDEDTAKAWWEATQGPMSPPASTPEPTFLDGAREFLRIEVKANRIKAGELIYGDNDMERATATVIGADSIEKYVVIKKEETTFSMEDFTSIARAIKEPL